MSQTATRETKPAPPPTAQFFMHLAQMCVAMCAGGVILSLTFYGAASLIGQSNLDRQYPEMAILVGAVSMSVAMAAWMLYRHHPESHIWEMSGATLVVGIALSSLFWVGVFPESSIVGWYSAHAMLCGPACAAMVLVMLRHLDHYTGRAADHAHLASA